MSVGVVLWLVFGVAILAYQAGRWVKERDITKANQEDWREIVDLKARIRKLERP